MSPAWTGDMEMIAVVILVVAILVLIAFNLLAARFGADSRRHDGRPNWW